MRGSISAVRALSVRAAALGLALLSLPDSRALAQEPARQRVAASGETLDEFRFAIDLEGVDWDDAAAVVRAYAEVEGELNALDPVFERLMRNELERHFRDLVVPELLPQRDLEDGPERTAARVELGTREDLSPAEIRQTFELWTGEPVAVPEGEPPQEPRLERRLTLRRGDEGRWRVTRVEASCFMCSASGHCGQCEGAGTMDDGMGGSMSCPSCAGGRTCESCQGGGWRDDPPEEFPAELASPAATPAIDRSDPASVATAVAGGEMQLMVRFFGAVLPRMRSAYDAYCAAFFSPELLERREEPNLFGQMPEIAVVSQQAQGEGRTRVVLNITTRSDALNPETGETETSSFSQRTRIDLTRGEDGSWRATKLAGQCYQCDAIGRCAMCQGSPPPPGQPPCGLCEGRGTCQACEGEGYIEQPIGPR